jgi:hypothetical protein
MKPSEFAQLIKSKYPQYQNVSDENLVGLVTSKYPQYKSQIDSPSIVEKVGSGVGKFIGDVTGLSGIRKGIDDATNLEKASEDITKSALDSNKIIEEARKLPIGDPNRKILLQVAGSTASLASQQAEASLKSSIKESQVAASAGKLALTTATAGTPGVASLVSKPGVALAARATESGITGAVFQALSNIEKDVPIKKGVGTATAIAASIPIVGKVLSGAKNLIGKTGQKIQTTVIRPLDTDVKDGFKIDNIKKYDLGGSLGQTYQKTQSKLNELTKQLNERVKRSDVTVDLNEVYEKTVNSLSGSKSSNFGNISSGKRVLENLANEIEEVSSNGLVDLAESQAIKQAAGKKGAWVFGSADPDATAVEQVYTAFYRELKNEIEQKAPGGVAEINRQISELIPIMRAVIRRIPVAERNNLISLTDLIGLGFSSIDPSAVAVLAINKLSKSGRVGNLLSKIASQPAKTSIGKRVFGN